MQKPNQFLLGVILTAQLPLWSPTSIMRGVNQRYVKMKKFTSYRKRIMICVLLPQSPQCMIEMKDFLLSSSNICTLKEGISGFLPIQDRRVRRNITRLSSSQAPQLPPPLLLVPLPQRERGLTWWLRSCMIEARSLCKGHTAHVHLYLTFLAQPAS